MATRKKIEGAVPATPYFAQMEGKEGVRLFSSGCALLDCVLGGGLAMGRVANIVGDKSTGKTLLAIEASRNFVRTFEGATIRYCEAESAFDVAYAREMGMPVDQVSFTDTVVTVEDFYRDVEATIKKSGGKPCLYILDSLDALSSKGEMDREIDVSTYGSEKAKMMSQAFRRLVQTIENSNMAMIIISQIRDKIGVVFGESHTRSGGRALDFYASQVVWLSELEKMKRTVKGVERVVGIRVKARCKKNKIGLPFREASFPVLFGYGVDDLYANTEWLFQVRDEKAFTKWTTGTAITANNWKMRVASIREGGGEEAHRFRQFLDAEVRRVWSEIEVGFLPKSKKYEDG